MCSAQPIKVLCDACARKETISITVPRLKFFRPIFLRGIFPRPARIELRSEVVAINQGASLRRLRGPRGIGLIMQPVWHVGRKQTAAGAFVTWHATTQSADYQFSFLCRDGN